MATERVTASNTIEAAPEAVFAVLADPSAHADVDGTGWVRESPDGGRITAASQVFRMAMCHEAHPDKDYKIANLVEVFDEPRAIVWKPGTESPETEELKEMASKRRAWTQKRSRSATVTLVVGEQHDDRSITLVADSKLTFKRTTEWARTNAYVGGALKLIIVRDSLCVGIAGPYDPDCVRSLTTNPGVPVADMVRELRDKWRECEFVVASLEEGTELRTIKRGNVASAPGGRAWIGEPRGFSRYQHARAEAEPISDNGLRVLMSLQDVLGRVDSVDGFPFRVASRGGRFRFVADRTTVGPEVVEGFAHFDADRRLVLKGHSVGPPDFFDMECCPGVDRTFRACGYFVPRLGRGFVWPHENPAASKAIDAASASEFVRKASAHERQQLSVASDPYTIT